MDQMNVELDACEDFCHTRHQEKFCLLHLIRLFGAFWSHLVMCSAKKLKYIISLNIVWNLVDNGDLAFIDNVNVISDKNELAYIFRVISNDKYVNLWCYFSLAGQWFLKSYALDMAFSHFFDIWFAFPFRVRVE